ncbi:MAG: hypothetical protein WAV15_02705 [Minisyncoccia bacterium]
MSKKSIVRFYLRPVFYVFLVTVALVLTFTMFVPASASAATLSIQLSDSACGGTRAGSAATASASGTASDWSGYAIDSNGYDADCAKVDMAGITESMDFRVGIQLTDGDAGCSSSEAGTSRLSPWASTGGGYTAWASDSNSYDPDCAQVYLETRPAPDGAAIKNASVQLQASDNACSSQLGSSVAGAWVTDSNGYDFDCLRLKVVADVVPLGTVTVQTQAFDKDGNLITSKPAVSWTISGPPGAPNCNGTNLTEKTCERMPYGSYAFNPDGVDETIGTKTYEFIGVVTPQTLGTTSPPAGACPSGQANPHLEYNSSGSCGSVNSCGASECSVGGGGGNGGGMDQQLNFLPRSSIFSVIKSFFVTKKASALLAEGGYCQIPTGSEGGSCGSSQATCFSPCTWYEPGDGGGDPLPTPPPPNDPPPTPVQIFFTIQYKEKAVVTPTASCTVSPASPMANGTNPTITFTTNSSSNYCYVRNDNLPSTGNPALPGSNFPSVAAQPLQLSGGSDIYSPGALSAGIHNGTIYCQTTSGTTITEPNSGWQSCQYTVSASATYDVLGTHNSGGTITSTNPRTNIAAGASTTFTLSPTGTNVVDKTDVSSTSTSCVLNTSGWSGNTYTTGAINADCTYSFSFKSGVVSPVPYVDLTASTPTPTTAAIGTPVTFSSAISNDGTASTGASFYNLFQVATATNGGGTITSLTPALSTTTLNAGTTRSVNSPSYTFTGSAGTRSVRACADKNSVAGTGTISEASPGSENNNCSAWRNVLVGSSYVDLTASTPTPTTATVGVAQTFTSTITNSGTVSTGAGFANLFQTSTLANGGGIVTDYLVSPNMSSLLAGTNAPATKSITFSSAGTIYMRACADKNSATGTGTISEVSPGSENNNCSAWVAITLIPQGTIAGTHDQYSGTVASSSQCHADGWAAYSTDKALDLNVRILSDGVSVATGVAGTYRADLQAAGVCTGGTCGFYINLAGVITPGVNHVITAQAQNPATLAWTSLASTPKTLNCPSSIDLTASAPTQNTATIGSAKTFTSNISNAGTNSTGVSFYNSLQVATAAGGVGAVNPLIASTPSPMTALTAGTSSTASASYTFTGSAGTRSVRFCADNNTSMSGTITETPAANENNNCSSWTNVIVSAACSANQGNACSSSPNSCGQVSSGVIQCSGNCSASTPSESSCTGGVCTNGSTNYPTCNNVCANGATNPPTCDINPGANGVCSPNHYSCSSPTASTSNVNAPDRWTWICPGISGTNASCSELKKKPIFIED